MTRYHDLADQTAALIADGVLRPGDRLPSVRHTCRLHGLAPVTVTQAYHLLESRGLIEARPRSGYFVRARLGQRLPEPEMSRPVGHSTQLEVSDFIFEILDSTKDPAVVPLGSSFPARGCFPSTSWGAAWPRRRGTSTRWPPSPTCRRATTNCAASSLRYLAQGARVPPQEIVITSGAMEGLNLCLQAVTRPGDLIAIESPTFYAGLQASERLGLKVVEIPSHPREGVSLEALEDALRHHPIKACLFMLNFANPTGSCVPDARRRALVELLDRHDVPLIEDDVYAELHFGPTAPLCSKAVDPRAGDARVVVLQVPGAGLPHRLGGGRALRRADPAPEAVHQPGHHRAGADRAGRLPEAGRLREPPAPPAPQPGGPGGGAGGGGGGPFPEGTRLARPQGGYFLWLELPRRVDALALHRQALAQGISIAPGPIFSAKREFGHCIRLNFGHPVDARSREAVATLGRLLAA
jgi:DNA-binding transcriptional MocR family regulator